MCIRALCCRRACVDRVVSKTAPLTIQRLCENVFEEVLKHENIIDKIDLSVDYLGE